MDYVQSCKVQGDYAEFGVYKGRTFAAACFLGRERRLTMRFWAFDSFAGLPDSEGEFRKGQFECGREEFLRIVRRCARCSRMVFGYPVSRKSVNFGIEGSCDCMDRL